MNELRTLVNAHLDKWLAAGKYVLPEEHDCLEFIVTEAAEALQAKMRINPHYVRNNPMAASERDIAVELFDTMTMCLVYERVTGKMLHQVKTQLSETNFKSLHRIIHSAARALVVFDGQLSYHEYDKLECVSRAFQLAGMLIEKLGFALMEIAHEKLSRMDAKRQL